MIIHESDCARLKRQGAEYVARLLAGKTRQEVVEFWRKRTERLRLLHKNGLHLNDNLVKRHYNRNKHK